jgi:hypothetical protein
MPLQATLPSKDILAKANFIEFPAVAGVLACNL